MTIKLDDNVYEPFATAAKILTKSGITISVVQLAETIINTEINGMNPTTIAKKFTKSIANKLTEIDMETDSETSGSEKGYEA